MSLVLMWPSTLMQLKLSSAASESRRWASARVQTRVSQHDAQHGRHARADHSRALGHAT